VPGLRFFRVTGWGKSEDSRAGAARVHTPSKKSAPNLTDTSKLCLCFSNFSTGSVEVFYDARLNWSNKPTRSPRDDLGLHGVIDPIFYEWHDLV
jgi:hypothetical protein